MGEINILYFYASRSGGPVPETLLSMLELSVASARRFNDVHRVILARHPLTEIDPPRWLDDVLTLTQPKLPPHVTMLLRTACFRQYSQSPLFDRPTVCTEHDVLFQGGCAELFEQNFDFGCTFATTAKRIVGDFGKLNGGVMFMNDRRKDRTRRILQTYFSIIARYGDRRDARFSTPSGPMPAQIWGGDELALIEMLPGDAFDAGKAQDRIFKIKDGRLGVFHSAKWNNTSSYKGLDGGIVTPFEPEARLRHFQGARKENMEAYAKEHLGLAV